MKTEQQYKKNDKIKNIYLPYDYYTLLNAHIQYQTTKRLSFYIDLQNILQDRFQEIYGYNTMGRTIQLGFRRN